MIFSRASGPTCCSFSRVPVLGAVNICRNFRISFSVSQIKQIKPVGSWLRILAQDFSGGCYQTDNEGKKTAIVSEDVTRVGRFTSKPTHVAVGTSFTSSPCGPFYKASHGMTLPRARVPRERKGIVLCCLFGSILQVTYPPLLLPWSVH